MAEQAYTVKDYKSDLQPIWCPGCGDYGVLTAIQKSLNILQIPPHNIAAISGIGCSSRLPGYLSTYGFNSIHGRAIPIATSVKVANPALTVIAVGGDGDGFSIGGGHLAHAVRRNIDLTYIIMDNSIYGLTKGQTSPTTPLEYVTKTSAYGNVDEPINQIAIMLGYGASFIAKGFAGDGAYLSQLIVQAMQHKGFSFIDVLSPCVTYQGKQEYDRIREKMVKLDDDPSYDKTDITHAWRIAQEKDKISIGVIYQQERSTFEDRMIGVRQKAKAKGTYTVEEMMNTFLP